jgi:hypothetical protein
MKNWRVKGGNRGYICVVNRRGMLVGVTQRVKGMRLSETDVRPGIVPMCALE